MARIEVSEHPPKATPAPRRLSAAEHARFAR
jgi:hypothetical protein